MPLIQVFARPPVEKKVKTRLIAELGAAAATRIYRYCLGHTLRTVDSSSLPAEVWLSEAGEDPVFNGFTRRIQQGDDLGARMYHALADGLERESEEAVVLIGSDCLDLRTEHLRQAADSLQFADLVLLPCHDGGFAMIGCRHIDPSLFAGIAWSSDSVLKSLVANARGLGYSIRLLETVRDIDTLQDVIHYPDLLELMESS